MSNIPPVDYAAGRDLVAYTDDYDKHFHLFYKGTLRKLWKSTP